MPKAKRKKSVAPNKKIELDADAWPKFEQLIRSAAKMGHKPHNTMTSRLASASKSKGTRR